MGDYTIKDIYQGGYSTLDPEYGKLFTGYRIPVKDLGITTDPSNARVAQEVSSKINLGGKNVEIELLLPKTFDAMNKHDFKEIDRLSKLTGVDMSFHGPLVEPSGIDSQGSFTESGREAAERQIQESIERSHDANPKGGIINFHTSNLLPSNDVRIKEEGGKRIEETEAVWVMNLKSGKIASKLPIKEKHFGKEEKMNIDKELEDYNQGTWDQQITQLDYGVHQASQMLHSAELDKLSAEADEKTGGILTAEQKESISRYGMGKDYLKDSYRQLSEMFETAYDNCSDEDRAMLDDLNKKIILKVEKINADPRSKESIKLRQEVIQDGMETFRQISAPRIFQKADDFMVNKTSTTFGNAAFNSFKKFKENTPIMVIENPPATQQFSRAEDIKNIIEKSREQFVKQAEKEGMSTSEAKAQAEKLIGASWDVGHINMLRQFGFEEKDIVKETEKVAPFVKHIHLSDNFGFEHTELPMGMGNVPLKEIMKKLGKQGFEAKKIIEAGDWWSQHVPKGATGPFTPSLEAMGSPMYAVDMQPYWNQSVGLQQDYISQQGATLPDVNFQTWGAGFSQLPLELGGQMMGAQGSRTSGRPME